MKKRFLIISAIYWLIGFLVITGYSFSCGFSVGHDLESAKRIADCAYQVQANLGFVVTGVIVLYVLVVFLMIARWEKRSGG